LNNVKFENITQLVNIELVSKVSRDVLPKTADLIILKLLCHFGLDGTISESPYFQNSQ